MSEITTEAQLNDLLNQDASDGVAKKEYIQEQMRKAGWRHESDPEPEPAAKALTADEVRGSLKRLPMFSDETRAARPGAELNGRWERFGSWLTEVWQAPQSQQLRTIQEGSGDAGGFLVPEEFRAQLMQQSLEDAVVRPRATVIPMAGPVLKIPSIRDTNHSASVLGGVVAYWVPESGSATLSEPTFGQVALTAKKLTGFTRTSNEVLADSAIALESLLVTSFGNAIRYFEDDSFINGDGVGEPSGIINADCAVSTAKETGQAGATIVWENIVKMYSRMLPQSLGNAVWLAHPDTFPQLATMQLSVGTGGSAIWINNGSAGPPAAILGRPVIFTEKCQTLGTVGDILFTDLSYYLIGDRQALTLASSQHSRFTNDETVWRFTERLDGRPWIDSALTPRNGSNTLSPIVTLATRS